MALIRPSVDLRNNYSEISKICHETKEPIYITKNGTNDLVILSDEAYEELVTMYKLTMQSVEKALQAVDTHDTELVQAVYADEERIDNMERTLRKRHIRRLNEGLCSPTAGIVFADIISNLERIGDHAKNLADTVATKQQSAQQPTNT